MSIIVIVVLIRAARVSKVVDLLLTILNVNHSHCGILNSYSNSSKRYSRFITSNNR